VVPASVLIKTNRPVRLEVPDSLVTVADGARIRQVLANLLANVRAHTPPRTPATVRLARTHSAVVLEVADDGPGMAPEEAARAFDRFHHARGSGGSGLGLAIVAAVAAAHGGQAALRSAPGAGTVVRVELLRVAPPPPRTREDRGVTRPLPADPRVAPPPQAGEDPPNTGSTGG
jgi:signal transduction histidine kinase